MTREEFEMFETVCKAEWNFLSRTGQQGKSSLSAGFISHCPACNLAWKVYDSININRTWWKDYDSIHINRVCISCPIDVWRRKTRKNRREKSSCEYSNELYQRWLKSTRVKERKMYAAQISQLSWTFLPEYQKIQLGDDLTLFLKSKLKAIKKLEKLQITEKRRK